MSHITLAQKGLDDISAKKWDDAVSKLSTALQSSTNPAWLLARSKALVNLKRFDEALADAELAWHTAYDRNKRPLITEANYRRAVAYFRLGQYANADCCCIYAMRLVKGFPVNEKEDPALQWTDEKGFWTATLEDAKEEAKSDEINSQENGPLSGGQSAKPIPNAQEWRMASTLRMQILGSMERTASDDESRKVTVTAKPEKRSLASVAKTEEKPAATEKPAPVPAARPPVPSDTPMRLQDFQSNTSMSVSIFSKGVNKETLKTQFEPRAVKLDSLIYPSGEEKPFELELWGEIDTEASKVSVTPNKVELTLVKKVPGKWAQLKADGKANVPANPAPEAKTTTVPVTEPAAAMTSEKAPEASGPAHSYPSSSKSGPKNWDKLGDDGSDEEGDVNIFFKKLYKNATPEQQRAMMKSFTESNGTSLSTDWNDVKARKVETVPPEGVEAKKWG